MCALPQLQEVLQSDGQWSNELDKLQAEFTTEVDRMEEENDVLKQMVGTLRKEVGVLKDSTLVGEKQRQVDVLNKKLASSGKLVDEMRVELETLSADKKQLAERLISYDENMDQQIYERIGEERELARVLQKKNEALVSRLQDCEDEILKEEQRSAALSREVDELSHWKVIYENGHGLQELARHQKKMKEDQRRLGLTLEQMSAQLSDTIESKTLLETAFYKLKIEAGKDENFEYPKLELREEMRGETAKLRLQVQELEEQIHSLEDDTVKLRKALKNQAATFGEDGFKYAGMSPEQLLKVNEFASNLRDGRIELPLDNRSSQLLKDNRQLREDLRLAQLKINRYELELCGLGDDQPAQHGGHGLAALQGSVQNEQSEAELQGLRVDVRNLLHENVSLRGSMKQMRDELALLLQQQMIKTDGGQPDSLTVMLMANNDQLMKENEELRQRVVNDKAIPAANTSSHRQHETVGSQIPPLHPEQPQNQLSVFGQRTPVKPPQLNTTLPVNMQHTPGGLDQPMASMRMNMTMGTGGWRATTGGSGELPGGNIPLATPRTPHGKTILSRTLATMGPLPPEEWADELKELNGQLIECLEQLFEKEEELNQQREIITHMETHLVDAKQQMSAAYVDCAMQHEKWTSEEKRFKDEAAELRGQRDDLKLKLRRVEETLDLFSQQEENQHSDDHDNGRLVSSLQNTIRENSRKLTVYEVNEAVLCRKFTTLNEQMQEESRKRHETEEQFAEMEGVLKRRVLFLENYKAGIEPKVAKLQCQLDSSVPHKDYVLVENELESLRQDHLHALRRELAARVSAFDAQEKARQVRQLKQELGSLQADLKESNEMCHALQNELENQKDVTQRALRALPSGTEGGDANKSPRQSQSHRRNAGGSSSHEMGALVSEMAKYRGDASRLQAELVSKDYRLEQTEAQLNDVILDLEDAERREQELTQRCEEAEVSEKLTRKALLDMEAQFDRGLKREDAEELRAELSDWKAKIGSLEQQNVHLKEMAQIAYDQAQSMANIRDSYLEEVSALRAHLVLHESRTDDDLIIGKLQRQLMATKTAYKAFTRKYQVLRGNMRQRELMQRVLEQRLDQRETGVLQLQENNRLEIGALRKALQTVHEKMISARGVCGGNNAVSAGEAVSPSKIGVNLSAEQFEFHDQLKRILHGKIPASAMTGGDKGPTGIGGKGGSIGEKMAVMSYQIEALSKLAEGAGDRAAESDTKSSKLAGEVEVLTEDNTILRKTIKNLTELMENTGFLPGGAGAGGGSSAVNKKQMQAQSRAIATKLLTLSEENRTLKMSSLQHRREVTGLQQEKQHLRAVLSRLEDDLREIESSRMWQDNGGQQELKVLEGFGFGALDSAENTDELQGIDLDLGLHSLNHSSDGQKVASRPKESQHDRSADRSPLQLRLGKNLSVDTSMEELPNVKREPTAPNRGHGHITKDELLEKNEQMTTELLSAQRDLSGYKRQCEHMQQRLQEAQEALVEREDALGYYERLATAENLPLRHPGVAGAVGQGGVPPRTKGSDYRLMREEQEKLQEAASATIGSMRSLLEDKNKEIERLRNKIDKQISKSTRGGEKGHEGSYSSHIPSVADRRAEELLARLADEDRYASHMKGRGRDRFDDGPSRAQGEAGLVQRLMDQIDRADEILQDKVKTISQLELKVTTLHAQREKAEQRCGATLEEMESMKLDMVTLVQQLKDSEEKYMQIAKYNQLLAQGGGTSATMPIVTDGDAEEQQHHAQTFALQIKGLKRKNNELAATVKSKDDKMKQYRNIIIGLKEEFIKSEEERAIFEAQHGGRGDGLGATNNHQNSSEMETLRDQVVALRDGLRQAKQDIEVAKRAREKLQAARNAAVQESDALEGQLGRAEAQAGAAQEALQRCRRELEDSRKREVRLRQKLKDLADKEAENGSDQNSSKPAVTDRLQREIEALRTENTILRQRVVEGGGARDTESVSKAVSDALEHLPHAQPSGDRATSSPKRRDDVDEESEEIDQGGGQVLGRADPGDGVTGMGDLRRQLHNKWEAEKRLQKRISTLETRLKDKVDECKDVNERFRRAQQVISQQAQQAGHTKEQKSSQKESRMKAGAQAPSDSVTAHSVQLEESRQKVFDLEEENERLRRLAMVQLPNELSTVRHRCDTNASRVAQLEQELEDAEFQLKAAKNGSSSLRASEDRFMQLERMKEELHAARKQRLELEASVLERDSKSLELRFEIEAKEGENIRLRRRLKELENVSRTLQQNSSGSPGRPRTTGQTPSSGGNSESVIESLRKVVDKLKGENDRLRRGIGVDSRPQHSSSSPSPALSGDKDRKLLTQEKKKSARLEEEVRGLQEKIRQLEDGGQKLVQRQQQVAALRKQLKSKDDRVAQAEQRVAELEADQAQSKQRLSDSHNRLQQLEMQLATSQSAAASALSSAQRQQQQTGGNNAEKDKEMGVLRRQASEAALEVQTLKAQLGEARRELRQARDAGSGPTGGSISRVTAEEQQLLKKLTVENKRLKDELSAFDLDFFEEIENLKYAHSEATKLVKWYEKKYGKR